MNWLKSVKRDFLRRGSPAFRVGAWVAGVGGALLWIYLEETQKPIGERVLFLPSKRQVLMGKTEIDTWNERLSGGKLLAFEGDTKQQQQEQQGVEAARAKALADIEQQEQQRAAAEVLWPQRQQGWLWGLLGTRDGQKEEQQKPRKVSLLFDK